MSTSFGVTEKMDVDTLAHVVELRQRDGLHVDCQYGIRKAGQYDWDFQFPDPLYQGASIRMFLYHRQHSFGKIRMFLDGKNSSVFVSVDIDKGNINLSYNGHQKGSETNPQGGPIATNKFVSMGVRIDRNLLLPLVNRWVGSADMGQPVVGSKWMVKIYTGTNYFVSLHVCDEVGGNFPATGLGQFYTLDGLFLPIGSYVTVFAVFKGGTPDGKTIKISFPDDGAGSAVTHQNATLNVNDEFRITVRNSNEGWIVTTSYRGDTQNAEVVKRTNSDKEKFTNVQVSSNCFIKRILAVCGVLPIQYRQV